MSNSDIYRETILDHYRNPRNKGSLSNHDVSVQDSNPLCGDEIEIHLKVEANMIRDMKFEGRGCAISQASASQLTEMVINKSLIFAMNLSNEDIYIQIVKSIAIQQKKEKRQEYEEREEGTGGLVGIRKQKGRFEIHLTDILQQHL